MPKKTKSYKKTEKWWLALVVFFYVLYNLPGVPPYGNAHAAILHGSNCYTTMDYYLCRHIHSTQAKKTKKAAEQFPAGCAQ